jgi:GT2 family glycosyltransferase
MIIDKLSVVIPTFKREQQVIKILDSLNNQISADIHLEVNICDSFSEYNFKNLKKFKKNIVINYLNIKENILSSKRNHGIIQSTYNNIILIDDDCIPDKNFINSYINDFSKIGEDTIFSGIVLYPKEYIKKYNHIKFKQSRHFTFKKKNIDEYLDPDKIVAMNMGFIKSDKITKLGLFNENFTGYGFEDYEFAYRYYKNGFKLEQTSATIIHDEGHPDINSYIKKYYHLGRDGMQNLININIDGAKETIYYKIEKNWIFNFISKVYGIKKIIKILEKFISKLDKINKVYIPFTINFLRLISYLRGYIDRDLNKINLNKNWYE